jgi:hypothetical protein
VPAAVTLAAAALQPAVLSADRSTLPASGLSTLRLTTVAVPAGAVAELVGSSGPVATAGTDVRSPSSVLATFDLRGAIPDGAYSLRLRSGAASMSTLATPVQVAAPAGGAGVRGEIVLPPLIRNGADTEVLIRLTNDGQTDVRDRLVRLRDGTGRTLLTAPMQGAAAPRTLLPGETATLSTRLRLPAGLNRLLLSQVSLSDVIFDWDGYAGSTPSDLPASEWTRAVSDLRGRIGSTWAQLTSLLQPLLPQSPNEPARDLGEALMMQLWTPDVTPGPIAPDFSFVDFAPVGTQIGTIVAAHGWNSSVITPTEPFAVYANRLATVATQRGYRVVLVDWSVPASASRPWNAGVPARSIGIEVGRALTLGTGHGLVNGPVNISESIANGHSLGNVLLSVAAFSQYQPGQPVVRWKSHLVLHPPNDVLFGSNATFVPLSTRTLAMRSVFGPVTAIADQRAPMPDAAGQIRRDLTFCRATSVINGRFFDGHAFGYLLGWSLLGSDPDRWFSFLELTAPDVLALTRRADGFHGTISPETGFIAVAPCGQTPEWQLPPLAPGLPSDPPREVELASATTTAVGSFDPNDIVGPPGVGPERWIGRDATLPYMIRFENVATATAPAQGVFISQMLDADLDLSTFRFGDVAIGNRVFTMSGVGPTRSATFDLRAEAGVLVRVEAELIEPARLLLWSFVAVDPESGQTPADPRVGLLPPNTTPPLGEGYVTYTVSPRGDATTGTRIDARARIVFDSNEPIDTPPIFNTVDADPPVVGLMPPAAAQPTPARIAWSLQDNGAGAPLSRVTLTGVDRRGASVPLGSIDGSTAAFSVGMLTFDELWLAVQGVDAVGNAQPAPTQSSTIRIKCYDFNRDGFLRLNDYLLVIGEYNLRRLTADVNRDGSLTPADLAEMRQALFANGCPGDFDGDGTASIDDVFLFLNAWFALDPRADADGVQGVNIDDIFVYLNVWFAGC